MIAWYAHIGTQVHTLTCDCIRLCEHTTNIHTCKINTWQRQSSDFDVEKKIDSVKTQEMGQKEMRVIYFLGFLSSCKVPHLNFHAEH